MNHQPFSVAISVYKNDNPVYFDRALESITDKQTIKPDEIVVVVDGPVSEEIDAVIEKYSSKYCLNAIRLETNGGLGNALRIATENCSNELIARMDSDDISVQDRFEQQLRLFESDQRIDIVGGNITEFIGEENHVVGIRNVPKKNSDIRKYMKKRCAMNHVTVMFKKQALLNAGGYLEWHFNEDYYLWIRMLLNNAVFANTGTVLVNVRTGLEMYARRGGIRYYKSEKDLQKFMKNNGIIRFYTYITNCLKRYFVQCILPNRFRGMFYRKFARKKG